MANNRYYCNSTKC